MQWLTGPTIKQRQLFVDPKNSDVDLEDHKKEVG